MFACRRPEVEMACRQRAFIFLLTGIDLLEVASIGSSSGSQRRLWKFPLPFL
uniref:Uncharacterized protein n=1 Tax=Manihot esculenta TaxID=3983 RepID=A0A2C9VV71_MANES